ncbi:MAG: diguanylate cyclase [Erythrobacter sp.]
MPYPAKFKRRKDDDSRAKNRLKNGANDSGKPNTAACDARRELLSQIMQFMERHDLNVSSANLSAICDALSGANPQLGETISSREISGHPIDQRWLDSNVRLNPATNDRMSELETLMDKLETSLARFAQTAKSAHDETSDHRGEIGRQIEKFEESDSLHSGGREVDRVIELSRAMLGRLEQVEHAMERSEAETGQLRDNLAQARQEADIDHLTRLPNRRAFERRLTIAAENARTKGQPLCVAFCDVDHFKKVNDQHGHDAGDRILCAIADTLSEIANDECFIARHGGEEFVLLFDGLGKEEAWRRLDATRRMMADRNLMNRQSGKSFGRITFSGGIAEVTEDIDTRSALARADEALYQAKAAGRNQIISI